MQRSIWWYLDDAVAGGDADLPHGLPLERRLAGAAPQLGEPGLGPAEVLDVDHLGAEGDVAPEVELVGVALEVVDDLGVGRERRVVAVAPGVVGELVVRARRLQPRGAVDAVLPHAADGGRGLEHHGVVGRQLLRRGQPADPAADDRHPG